MPLVLNQETTPEPEHIVELIADELEGFFAMIDWNDLGELTIQYRGRVFRGTFFDITDENDD